MFYYLPHAFRQVQPASDQEMWQLRL